MNKLEPLSTEERES